MVLLTWKLLFSAGGTFCGNYYPPLKETLALQLKLAVCFHWDLYEIFIIHDKCFCYTGHLHKSLTPGFISKSCLFFLWNSIRYLLLINWIKLKPGLRTYWSDILSQGVIIILQLWWWWELGDGYFIISWIDVSPTTNIIE